MKKFILVLIFCLMAWPSWAAPSITGVSGEVSSGETITITGSGFGTKSPVAPLVFDDFEDGTLDTTATVGAWSAIGDGYAYIDTQYVFSGTYAHRKDSHGDNNWSTLRHTWSPALGDDEKFYMYVVRRYATAPSAPSHNEMNLKDFRIWPTSGGLHDFFTSLCGNPVYNVYQYTDCEPSQPGTFYMYPPGATWHSVEWEMETSSGLNQSDGYCKYTQAYPHATPSTAIQTFNRTFMNRSSSYAAYWSIMYVQTQGQCPSAMMPISQDDVYIDRTWARVMIGSHNTFATSQRRVIQVPHTTWNDTTIQITVNRGDFAADGTAYLYVIDASGTASNGYEITFGDQEASPSTPSIRNGGFRSGGIR